MWKGMFPAVTSKFTESGELDHAEMERCFGLMIDSGCDGLIVCGSLGEGPMMTFDERIEVLHTARRVAQGRPVLLTVADSSTAGAVALGKKAAEAGADGLMVVPSPIYHTDDRETERALRAVAEGSDLPIMIYSNRVAYRVDVTPELMQRLADDKRFVAIKESSDDIRRTLEIRNMLGDRYDVFTGVDNLAFEAMVDGAIGWVGGLVVAFPEESVCMYKLIRAGRYEEALAIYRWLRPVLDLDVSTYLVQNIKLAEALAIGSTEWVREPRLPLVGDRRAYVEAVVRKTIETRPSLPAI